VSRHPGPRRGMPPASCGPAAARARPSAAHTSSRHDELTAGTQAYIGRSSSDARSGNFDWLRCRIVKRARPSDLPGCGPRSAHGRRGATVRPFHAPPHSTSSCAPSISDAGLALGLLSCRAGQRPLVVDEPCRPVARVLDCRPITSRGCPRRRRAAGVALAAPGDRPPVVDVLPITLKRHGELAQTFRSDCGESVDRFSGHSERIEPAKSPSRGWCASLGPVLSCGG
jgi:hypothetical protein